MEYKIVKVSGDIDNEFLNLASNNIYNFYYLQIVTTNENIVYSDDKTVEIIKKFNV